MESKVLTLSQAQKLDALVVFVDGSRNLLTKLQDKALLDEMKKPMSLDFKGRYKDSDVVYTLNHPTAKRVLLYGLGKVSDVTLHKLRTASAGATSALKNLGVTKNVGFALPTVKNFKPAQVAEALVGGNRLSQVGFDHFKTDRKEEEKAKYENLSPVLVIADRKDLAAAKQGWQRGLTIADGVNWARHLILNPGGHLYPEVFVEEMKKMIASSPAKKKITAKFFTRDDLKKMKFGGLLGVGQGSDRPPYFAVLEYKGGKKSDQPICLVGKGITFDSGGLSLKPPQAMETMKYDMGGAASVLGAFRIICELGIKANVLCAVPTAENMPSGKAIRPGDILTMASGKTVEVLNTDAEGRLILADALHYVTTEYKPAAVMDVATLTGACAMALSEAAVGLFTNNKKLEQAVIAAGNAEFENFWPLPNYDDFYVPMLKSDVADIKNIGGREAGASTAGIFLRYFVANKTPWAHFDIAGAGWYESPRDFISTRGPSGITIRSMVRFVETNAGKKFS